jgi:RND superfamily putative drug exporter
MSLLGHRAWWLPRSLDRMLPTIDLEGTRTDPVTLPAPRAAGDDETEDEEELEREPALV